MTPNRISFSLCLLTSLFFTFVVFAQDLKKKETLLLALINQEKNIQQRNSLIDSLLIVFEEQEKTGNYDQKNDLLRATFLFRSATPNPLKIDTLLYRAIRKFQYTVGDAILLQYCSNLNSCLQLVPSREKAHYKTRMLQSSYNINKWSEQQNYAQRTIQSIQLIERQIMPTCTDYSEATEGWLNELPSDKSEKTAVLRFVLKKLGTQKCPLENTFEHALDSLLSIEQSAELWIKKASFQAKRNDYENEYKSLIQANTLYQSEQLRDSIHFLLVENRFNSNENHEVLRLCREQNTRFKEVIHLRAAQSVIRHNEHCQVSAFEKRLNHFYALQMLKECGETNVTAKEISHSIDPLLPSKEELSKNGLKPGDSYHLKCWDITIKLPL